MNKHDPQTATKTEKRFTDATAIGPHGNLAISVVDVGPRAYARPKNWRIALTLPDSNDVMTVTGEELDNITDWWSRKKSAGWQSCQKGPCTMAIMPGESCTECGMESETTAIQEHAEHEPETISSVNWTRSREGLFTVDDETAFPGRSGGLSWNGWAMPMFRKEMMLSILKANDPMVAQDGHIIFTESETEEKQILCPMLAPDKSTWYATDGWVWERTDGFFVVSRSSRMLGRVHAHVVDVWTETGWQRVFHDGRHVVAPPTPKTFVSALEATTEAVSEAGWDVSVGLHTLPPEIN